MMNMQKLGTVSRSLKTRPSFGNPHKQRVCGITPYTLCEVKFKLSIFGRKNKFVIYLIIQCIKKHG